MRHGRMLSYQHSYHAGNLADVHKHALLAWMLAQMVEKDKPLSFIDTHAGRGLYDLGSVEARKTGEAQAGIEALADRFAPDDPYARMLSAVRAQHGPMAYPGTPLIARHLLRPQDRMTLAELHPGEHEALQTVMAGSGARIYRRDGLALMLSMAPPAPRRGVVIIDPSYEVKDDYTTLPEVLRKLRRKWNVGVLLLWYPVLAAGLQNAMLAQIRADHPDAAIFETRFPPARAGHGLHGAGLVVLNPPFGLKDRAAQVDALMRGQ